MTEPSDASAQVLDDVASSEHTVSTSVAWNSASTWERTQLLFLLCGGFILTCDQLLLVQPALYLEPLGHKEALSFRVAASLSLAFGVWCERFRRARWANATTGLVVAATGLAVSAVARFWAFDHGRFYAIVIGIIPCISLLALGFALTRSRAQIASLLRFPSGELLWLNPFALVTYVIGLCVVATLENTIGPLRSSIAMAGALLVAASQLERKTPRFFRSRHRERLTYAGLVALSGLALYVEALCPLRRVFASTHALVYTAATDRIALDVTAGQGGLHYFVNGELRFSTVDEYRFYQSLVLPALFRVPSLKRALVLSQGEGLIEREILEHANEARVTSVMRDRRIADSAKRQAYLRRLTKGSMLSPRVTLVERDPAAFALDLQNEQYDLIVVDLPDPSGPLEIKYYSRLFYQRLARHLSAHGLLTVQATSARRSPRTFATIGKTLQAAGLNTTPLMVPLVTRGEWSLYLCSTYELPKVVARERYERTFPGSIEQQMISPWPDTLPPKDFVPVPNTLHEGHIRELFDEESDEPRYY